MLLAGGLSLCALWYTGTPTVSRSAAHINTGHLRQVAYEEAGEIFESDEQVFESDESVFESDESVFQSDEQVEFERTFAEDENVIVDSFLSVDESVVEFDILPTVKFDLEKIVRDVRKDIPAKPPAGTVVRNKFFEASKQNKPAEVAKAVANPQGDSGPQGVAVPKTTPIPNRVVVANEFFNSETPPESMPGSNVDDARQMLARLQNQIQRIDRARQAAPAPNTDRRSRSVVDSDKDFLARFQKKIESATPQIHADISTEPVPDPTTDPTEEIDLSEPAPAFVPETGQPVPEVSTPAKSVLDSVPQESAPAVENQIQSKEDDLSFLQRIKTKLKANEALSSQAKSPIKKISYGRLSDEESNVKSIEYDSMTGADQRAELASAKLPTTGGGPKPVTQGTTDFRLAGQPELGYHFKDDTPVTDDCAWQVEVHKDDFSPDAIDPNQNYDPYSEMQVYEGKQMNANQRPLVELGRPWYQLGQLSEGKSFLGFHNNVVPQFIVHGDYRTAVANRTAGGNNVSQIAFELNLNLDLRLTSTERFVGFVAPLDNGQRNTSYLFSEDRFDDETDFDFDFGYFEGDLGAIVGGLIGETLPFDLPFAVGVMPLLVQNGVWLEDAFLGAAFTIPARNSARLGISNMDTTFFAGFDEIDSPAFEGDDDTAKMYGVLTFIEALNGYFEVDYAYLEDRNGARDRSYHNIGLAYSRRYGRFISNSTRVIVNAGQSTEGGRNTADGVLLLSENSLTTAHSANLVPYINFFAGFDNPQSAARSGSGVLRNTGILFESDGMTGFPTLDDSANDTFGASFGLNMLAPDFSQQLVLEFSALGVMGEDPNRNAAGDQYGLGFRYQLPLSNSVILRVDGMRGFLRNAADNRGLRVEMRHKF